MNQEDLFFVKRLFELSKKLNKNIKIASKDDAANLYAYLKGYTSWAEMLRYERSQKIEDVDMDIDIKDKIFTDKIWNFKKDILKDLEKEDFYIEKSIYEKTNILDTFKIGNIEVMKSLQPALIDCNSNAYIFSDINNVSQRVFREQVKELFYWNKSSIICGLNNKGEDDELNNYLIDKQFISIGNKKSNIRLNPINELFLNDSLEEYFTINNNKENVFQDIWLNLIRIYKEQLNYKITPDFLKDSLKIETLIQLMTNVEKNIQLQIKPLINYINNFLDIVYVKEKQSFIISAQAQEKHYKQTFLLLDRVKKLAELYEQNIFDINSNITMFDVLKNKEPIIFWDINDNQIKKAYWDIIFQLLNNVLIEQEEVVEKSMVSPRRYMLPLLVWGSDNIITNKSMKVILKHEQFLKTHLYDLNPQNRNVYLDKTRDDFLNKLTQVLFLRQNVEKIHQGLENKIKNQTVSWGANLFYSNCNILRNLNDFEAILWQKDRMENTLSGLEDFILYKVNLTNSNI